MDKIHVLAEKITKFMEDYDYYEFCNSLEVGETIKDAIKRIADDLNSPERTDAILSYYKELSEEIETDSKEYPIVIEIIADLEEYKKENLKN